MSRVLVLNASYEPVNVTTVRRAIVLLIKERAEVVEDDEGELRAELISFSIPSVIRLITYVRIPRPTFRKVTRRAVLARDDWTCQYCGSSSSLTIDHVVPRSKGGASSWENLVASCSPCNRRKQDAEPRAVGMKLRRRPRPPMAGTFVLIEVRTPPVTWSAYLRDR